MKISDRWDEEERDKDDSDETIAELVTLTGKLMNSLENERRLSLVMMKNIELLFETTPSRREKMVKVAKEGDTLDLIKTRIKELTEELSDYYAAKTERDDTN